jgi:hypothetical protein
VNKPLATRVDRLGDLDVPAKGAKVTFPIDTAKNVHAVYLYWTVAGVPATAGEIKSDVGTIRVRVGGKLLWELTATEILDLYKYFNDANGALTVAGCLPLVFTPMMLPLTMQNRQYSLGMMSETQEGKRNTFTVEVNMLSPASLTVDACEVHLKTDDFRAQTIGYHTRWLRYGTTWPAASKQTIADLPKERNNMAALSYHVAHSVGTLTRVGLKVNDYERITDAPLALLKQLEHEAGRTPQSGYEPISFDLANDPAGFLELANAFNQYLDLTWSVAPTTYTILQHMLYRGL